MQATGAALWSFDGGQRTGARRRRAWAAAAGAVAALCVLAACAAPPPPTRAQAAAVRADVDAGLDLYELREFSLAAQRFHSAAAGAHRFGDETTERNATIAECTSWLRAAANGNFAACSQRLERLQARTRRPDPGVNTLIALGAVAGGRPIPPYRIPSAVRPVVLEAAKESR
jgi:hypothetical protein